MSALKNLPRAFLLALSVVLAACGSDQGRQVRFATYNVALNFPESGRIVRDLSGGEHAAARNLAAAIQRVRPDVLLLNEIDRDPDARALDLFADQYLGQGQHGEMAIEYPFRYWGDVNTGLSSGVDLNGDGQVAIPQDAHGWGDHHGQYAMAVLSRYPIDQDGVRSFQKFRWADMPDAWWPMLDDGSHYYSDAARAALRLSSKSHWDVPIVIGEQRIHLLASHPTPPVFDGPEDRNGQRNHDEIRLWADYISSAGYFVDDQGHRGSLPDDANFVIAGDLNADPNAGDSSGNPIQKLLDHDRVNSQFIPGSEGALAQTRKHDPQADESARFDTADFSEDGPGNLRIDYVLPSSNLKVADGGVFWPMESESEYHWVTSSDHRLVWIDLILN